MSLSYDKNTAKFIWDYLRKNGLTPEGTAGLMGNLYAESGLRANNLQNTYERKLGLNDDEYTKAVDNNTYLNFVNDSAGYGLAQWTYWSRKQNLFNFVIQRKKSIGDLQTQLEFLLWELQTSYSGVLRTLKSSNSVNDCGRCVMTKFERPANQSEANQLTRVSYCQEFYEVFNMVSTNKVVRVAIDAGHGLNTSGKRCLVTIDRNETREWSLNDRIADKLEALLKGRKCEVIRTDDTTGKTDVTLSDRVKKANNWKADVFISIHHNAGVNGGSGGGTVVYYYSTKAERKTQAQALYKAIVDKTKLVGNRSSKTENRGFYVIKNTTMPAFLIENGFMDSTKDVPIILSEDHANKSAQGIYDFLVKEFGV